jgi:hypothetical protein
VCVCIYVFITWFLKREVAKKGPNTPVNSSIVTERRQEGRKAGKKEGRKEGYVCIDSYRYVDT